MSSIVVAGDVSGSVTIAAPSAAGSTTLTLPSTSGTILASGSAVTAAQGGTGQTSLTANNVILGNGTSAVQFVAPSTNGNVLTSNGTTWTSAAAPSFTMPTGSVIQTVQTTTNSTATYVRGDYITVLQTSITPSSASNKILVIVNFGTLSSDTNADIGIDIYRGATQLTVGSGGSNTNCTFIPAMNTPGTNSASSSFTLLDSPSTTSSTDYKIRCMINSGRTLYLNRRASDFSYACISAVTLMEIKG